MQSLFDQATAQFQAGQIAEAERTCRALLKSEPRHAAGHRLLAFVAHAQERHEDAVELMRQAVALDPQQAGWHDNLGVLLAGLDRQVEAATAFRQALQLRPRFPAALNHLGLAVEKDLPAEALRAYQEALTQQPEFADAAANLGTLLQQLGHIDESLEMYRRTLSLDPDHMQAGLNLVQLLLRLGRLQEVLAHSQGFVARLPNHPHVLANHGAALLQLNRLDEALTYFQKALLINPQLKEGHIGRAFCLLLQGNWQEGLRAYEWRRWQWTVPSSQPLWDGSPLQGKRILLYREQGFGDTLMCLRFLPDIRARRGRVVLRVPARMIPLLDGLPDIAEFVDETSEPPPHDVQAPLPSLPRILDISPATIPASVPYLYAQPQRVTIWKERLAAYAGLRVGLAWQGNPDFIRDPFRSFPLQQAEMLARVPGVRLVSLQKGLGAEQVFSVGFPIFDPGVDLDRDGAFVDTAAIMKNLDLVIASDSAVAHLAGALGVRTWLALSASPDWRWLLERSDTPWYPTMRLFRQKRFGDWDEVFARMAQELTTLPEAHG